ncbi:hypothetical protein CANCADRAFT_19046, partial [Tortispora caseinolytica NRRL Y-17796]
KDLQAILKNLETSADDSPSQRLATPASLNVKLLPHQQIGLTWMTRLEDSDQNGLLADEMGLGKTVQALALMLKNRSKDITMRTTLIVAPVSLIYQWQREIESKVRPEFKLTTLVYHGTMKRNLNFKAFSMYDVVITTYGVITSEHKKHMNKTGRERGNTFFGDDCKWFRIILDESQMIKNVRTQVAAAAFSLKAQHKWCLSGTPMQNSVDEFYSTVKFLDIKPYNSKDYFNRVIGRPLKIGNQPSKTAMQQLQVLLRSMCLRRTKDSSVDGQPVLQLPPRNDEVLYAEFDPEHKRFYELVEQKVGELADRYMERQGLNNYAHMLVLLLRLRQACDHMWVCRDKKKMQNADVLACADEDTEREPVKAKRIESLNANILSDEAIRRIKSLNEDIECSSCLDVLENEVVRIVTPCGHIHCVECLLKIEERANLDSLKSGSTDLELNCDYCGGGFEMKGVLTLDAFAQKYGPIVGKSNTHNNDGDESAVMNQVLNNVELTSARGGLSSEKLKKKIKQKLHIHWKSSGKLDKAAEVVEENISKGVKTLIFTQFLDMIRLMEIVCETKGWKCISFDGSMSSEYREEAISSFNSDPTTMVMIMSLKAGNTGLNLTVASCAIIFDPFWNPYVEEQAIGRVHRIGQQMPVSVKKLIVQNTVEDRILTLQEKKRSVIDGALDEKGLKAVSRLSQSELRFLFGISS